MAAINVHLKRKGRGGCWMKSVLGICLVEATGISKGKVELFLVVGL